MTTETSVEIDMRFEWILNDLHKLVPDEEVRPLAVIAPAPTEAIIFLWK